MMFVTHGKTQIDISVDKQVANERIIHRIKKGGYEQREAKFARQVIQPEDRILELGAGLGFISAAVCSQVQPQHYTAVEADERLIPHIHRTHERNKIKGVDVIQGAFVANPEILEKGFIEFGVAKAFWGSGIDRAGGDDVMTVRVPTRDVSKHIRDNRIDTLISDIEGGELDLFRHLDFSPLKRIIMEIHPKVFGLEGVREVFQILDRNNFVYDADYCEGSVVTFTRV
ncbi:FkbM family methyltransferase [Hyphomonas atlantica]|uniref:Methyltransferase FkbM domain-containing protein n=1 Tax=Hyphomonas atlantica TaxID=1280948 RepID=A0A059DVM3_9PROT|nr:FkbM family methyltransferase [Hyphomonas atlantica]KCZ57802.1 hypothetical protein HY36_11535 [Hyphomonas atlantica]